jgi:hypothetical protein
VPYLSLLCRFVHVSSAGVTRPNRPGINVDQERPAVKLNYALCLICLFCVGLYMSAQLASPGPTAQASTVAHSHLPYLSLLCRFVHVSSAGVTRPNRPGMNYCTLMFALYLCMFVHVSSAGVTRPKRPGMNYCTLMFALSVISV